jgi:hypothetical protein
MVFYLVQGDAIKNSFLIDTSSHTTVGHLKKAIKDAKQNAFSGIDTDKLTLWRVQTKENQEMTIKEHKEVELHSFESVETHFQEVPFITNIRIIVEPPTTTGKCLPMVYLSNKKFALSHILYFLIRKEKLEYSDENNVKKGKLTDFQEKSIYCLTLTFIKNDNNLNSIYTASR